MALPFAPTCLPLLLGSLPHRNAPSALNATRRYAGSLLAWPQMPSHGSREQQVVQGAVGFPGLIALPGTRAYVDRAQAQPKLTRLALAYLENDANYAAITPEHAGLTALVNAPDAIDMAQALKGQQSGPISLAVTLIDEAQRPLIYDASLFEALTHFVRLRATWQEQRLGELKGATIVCIDEPLLALVGQPFLPLEWDEARLHLDDVFAGISGCKALYAAGAVDWTQVLQTQVELIIADVYAHAASLIAAAPTLMQFIERDGLLGLGIVPADADALRDATAESLSERVVALLDMLAADPLQREQLVQKVIITSSDGLGQLDVPTAERALQLMQQVSMQLRAKYQLET